MTIYSIWTKHVTAFLLLVSQFVHKYILWIIIIYERFSFFFIYSCSIYYAGWNAYTTSLYKKMCSMINFQCEKNEYSTYHFSPFDNYCLCDAGCTLDVQLALLIWLMDLKIADYSSILIHFCRDKNPLNIEKLLKNKTSRLSYRVFI